MGGEGLSVVARLGKSNFIRPCEKEALVYPSRLLREKSLERRETLLVILVDRIFVFSSNFISRIIYFILLHILFVGRRRRRRRTKIPKYFYVRRLKDSCRMIWQRKKQKGKNIYIQLTRVRGSSRYLCLH